MNMVISLIMIQRGLQQTGKGRFYALLPNKASLCLLVLKRGVENKGEKSKLNVMVHWIFPQ